MCLTIVTNHDTHTIIRFYKKNLPNKGVGIEYHPKNSILLSANFKISIVNKLVSI